ncbi:hypothetical protein Tco_1189419 [Tanacetum coccineum]
MRNNLFMHGIKSDNVLGKPYLAFATGNSIPKKARKRTTAHINPIKESSLTADDNIISEDPDAALELTKSISKIEAEIVEETRLVHETHERLVTEKSARRRRQTRVAIRYTPTVTKKKTPVPSLKLKGMEMLSDAAMLAADIRKEMKTSLCDLKSPHQTGGLSEGVGSKPEVPDESKAKSSDQESENESCGDSEDDDDRKSDNERTESDDDKSIYLNKTKNEEKSQGDEFVHTLDDYVPTDDETQDVDDEEYVRINEELYDDVNVEMKDAKPANEGKGDEEMTDVEKVDVEPKETNQEVASAQV